MHKRVKENIGRYWFGKGRRERKREHRTGQGRPDRMGQGRSRLGKDIHLQDIHPKAQVMLEGAEFY